MKGNVTITAGQTASVRASDIIAGKDTLITGRNVDIESKDNTYRGKEEHEYKKSGLTVSLGGAAVNAARTVAAPVKRAGEVGDGRLKALYAVQADCLPFMWILYINRTFSRFGINNEGE